MKSLSYLNKYFVKYKWRLIFGILFVTISNLFAIFPAQIIREALDIVIYNLSSFKLFNHFELESKYYSSIASYVLFFAGLIVGMALLKGMFMFFMRQTIIVMSRKIEFDLKNEIFEHYQKLEPSFYTVNNTGDLMNRISEDVGHVRMYVGPAIMYTINMAVLFILVITTMISVNPKLTLFALIPLPILSVMIYYVQELINKKSIEVQGKLSDLSTFTQESFSGIRILKSFVREEKFSNDFSLQSNMYERLSMQLVRINALFHPSMLLLVGLSTLLTIFVGGIEAMNGNITLGNIAEFVIYVNMLTWPVAALGWVVSLVQRSVASQQRINEFLHTQPAILSGEQNEITIDGDIEFKNVSHVYPESNIRSLDNLSFKVDKGKSLAIIGRTGSGKTTIANLLLRLIEPNSGEIFIDDKDLSGINTGVIRDRVGYVPQDIFLFSDTISNNIAFGLKEDIEKGELIQRIEQAAKDSVVYDNIVGFPNKFETKLGERGITISGGQKQRISIARAIIKNPKILIFDDCLSAVDTKTEEEILQNLSRIMKDKTTIIIGHRVSSVKNADHILVLDDGKKVEEGTHEYLLEKKGFYHSMYKKQLLEEEMA
ncbi:MAG: ABC transporter ATP-binding protein [Bacteroidia bacterium]|nr:ABC transporter ATP-binding protein [Bacteroidia bacterium]